MWCRWWLWRSRSQRLRRRVLRLDAQYQVLPQPECARIVRQLVSSLQAPSVGDLRDAGVGDIARDGHLVLVSVDLVGGSRPGPAGDQDRS